MVASATVPSLRPAFPCDRDPSCPRAAHATAAKMEYTNDDQVDLVTPPTTPTGTAVDVADVKVEQLEEAQAPARTTKKKKSAGKDTTKGTKRTKLKKKVVKEQDNSPEPSRPQKRK